MCSGWRQAATMSGFNGPSRGGQARTLFSCASATHRSRRAGAFTARRGCSSTSGKLARPAPCTATRLMREHGMRAPHGYRTRRWVIGDPTASIPNLLQRQFTDTRPNAAWAKKIMCIRIWQGYLSLAVVLDLFSRKVVGWATGPTIPRELGLDAVVAVVRQHRPRETPIHSDQSVQYGAMRGVAPAGRTISSLA